MLTYIWPGLRAGWDIGEVLKHRSERSPADMDALTFATRHDFSCELWYRFWLATRVTGESDSAWVMRRKPDPPLPVNIAPVTLEIWLPADKLTDRSVNMWIRGGSLPLPPSWNRTAHPHPTVISTDRLMFAALIATNPFLNLLSIQWKDDRRWSEECFT